MIKNNLFKIFFILQSSRNVLVYLLIYITIRRQFPINNFYGWEYLRQIHFILFFISVFIGSFASWRLYKQVGHYTHFIYFKYEITIVLFLIFIVELLILDL